MNKDKVWKIALCGTVVAAMVLGIVACEADRKSGKPTETTAPQQTTVATTPKKPNTAKKPDKGDEPKLDAVKSGKTYEKKTADSKLETADKPSNTDSSSGSSNSGSSSNSESSKPTPVPAPAPTPAELKPTTPAPQPKPTEPAPTEPPVTEHIHTWVHEHTDEVGHWEKKIICTCGYVCTEAEARASGYDSIEMYWYDVHADPEEQATGANHSYDTDADWVVDVPASDKWTCSGCGEVTTSDPA